MWTERYDPDQGDIWVNLRLHGPAGDAVLNCVLDTGTPVTIIDAAVMDRLGYGASMGGKVSRLWGVGGPQVGYRLQVAHLETMGLAIDNAQVHCHDLPDKFGIEGLIGMDLLKGRILTLDGIGGPVTLAP